MGNFQILVPFRPLFKIKLQICYGPPITQIDDHLFNKKVQILEFSFCCPLSIEFIPEIIRDRGIRRHTTESSRPNQFKEKIASKLDEK
jgi:hypothetical protein